MPIIIIGQRKFWPVTKIWYPKHYYVKCDSSHVRWIIIRLPKPIHSKILITRRWLVILFAEKAVFRYNSKTAYFLTLFHDYWLYNVSEYVDEWEEHVHDYSHMQCYPTCITWPFSLSLVSVLHHRDTIPHPWWCSSTWYGKCTPVMV